MPSPPVSVKSAEAAQDAVVFEPRFLSAVHNLPFAEPARVFAFRSKGHRDEIIK